MPGLIAHGELAVAARKAHLDLDAGRADLAALSRVF